MMPRVEHFQDNCLVCESGSTHTLITYNILYVECDDCGHAVLSYLMFKPLIVKVHKEWKKINWRGIL